MKLRKGRRVAVEAKTDAEAEAAPTVKRSKSEHKSKRQRLVEFFRPRKQHPEKQVAPPIPTPIQKSAAPREPPRDSKIADSTRPAKSTSSVEDTRAGTEHIEQTPLASPPSGPKDDRRVEVLSEEYIHGLFSGAPHFSLKKTTSGSYPTVAYPWDPALAAKDASDSLPLTEPAFSAATLHRPVPGQEKQYQGYNAGTLEVPSMLSAQGIEPGSIGMAHFLELPKSDNLITDLQQSQSSNGFLEVVRNKEQMQSNPERLGIRAADMEMIYDRLIEFGDLYETFQDSPERISILNNQSPGDLYANLFSKFLTPPGYNSSTADPTGMKVQIDSLLKVLRLKGVWYDFSLVEWRIRLGQLLWGDPDQVPEHERQPLWTERELLLLQIALSCELLLRLDAVTNMDPDDAKVHLGVTPQDFESFLTLKTRKTEWDLVLARHFLENILVVREIDVDPSTPAPRSSGLMGLLGSSQPKEQLRADIVFLPRHQGRQLAGLLHFAERIQWPGIDLILKDLAQKLGVPDSSQESEQPTSPYRKFLEASTPSSMSIYSTPLPTPRSALMESYFGNVGKPAVSRSNSRSLRVPLSNALLEHADNPAHVNALNIGGWLSRSYLTGLIIPGEPIYHFLMSTLLENDKLAIASLGDSANLYGGFIYAQKTWWSKASIVGRVLACMDGAVECMGWISFTKLPARVSDSWFAITSEQIRTEQPPRISSSEDLMARDSAILPDSSKTEAKAEDLVLPLDLNAPPIPSISLAEWRLTPTEPEPLEADNASGSYIATENFTASVTFSSHARGASHTFTLTHDAHFITSWPCTPPATSLPPSLPHVLKRSLTSLSRTSSKRSAHSIRDGANRPSRRPSRRNSHGFEPLLSHPPDAAEILPQRMYSPTPDDEPSVSTTPKAEPLHAHPLHISYKHKIVPVTDILDPNFILPFTMYAHASPPPSTPGSPNKETDDNAATDDDTKNILVLDARASKDLELLARAWCAEKGLHAIIGRVGRTCLACCIREARGLGVNVVIRV